MKPELKGYVLTYLGCFLGMTLAAAAAYNKMLVIFQEFSAEKTQNIFTSLALAFASFGIAILTAAIIFQIVLLIAAPLFIYLLLIRNSKRVVRTVVTSFILLCVNPIFVIISILTGLSGEVALYITILWLLITPFLARLLATKAGKVRAV